MGEAKRKAIRRQEFFATHPLCVYCGSPATTFDHCPPRSFFAGRAWPETYEFPACEPCNSDARLDEQALAVLIRSNLTESDRASDGVEWEKLVRAVRNNQPYVLAEWQDINRNDVRYGLRRAFGSDGDRRRAQGWGLLNMGPLTQQMLSRFMIKLAKSLYYRQNRHIFDGMLYVHHIDRMSRDTTPEYLESVLRMAPALPAIERNKKTLSDQFIYRFNHSPEHRMMYAVVQFGLQFFFQLIAVSREMDAQLIEGAGGNERAARMPFRHECFLQSGTKVGAL